MATFHVEYRHPSGPRCTTKVEAVNAGQAGNIVRRSMEARCIRVGCSGRVVRSWSPKTGTTYQCETCKGCGKGMKVEITDVYEPGPPLRF